MVCNPVSHLTAAAQSASMQADEERIEYLRADRWIGYTRARSTLQRLEELFNWPSKQRMPNLLIIGPTNNGKSMIIQKFKRDHLWVAVREQADHELIPVVIVQTPSEPSVSRFYAMLLATIGAPMHPRARIAELEQVTLRLLRSVQAKILIIDELHNVLAGATDVRKEFLNLLRFLGNELRIPIVGVGTKKLTWQFVPMISWRTDLSHCFYLFGRMVMSCFLCLQASVQCYRSSVCLTSQTKQLLDIFCREQKAPLVKWLNY